MGRDHQTLRRWVTIRSFNPRARMGRDVKQAFYVNGVFRFQSTRPHGARHQQPQRRFAPVQVSIHAPAWGATKLSSIIFLRWSCFNPRARMGRDEPVMDFDVDIFAVSIHAPAWGATLGYPEETAGGRFNPRARMGRDTLADYIKTILEVSIHAPAWGATWFFISP